jgi:hypothetical protein
MQIGASALVDATEELAVVNEFVSDCLVFSTMIKVSTTHTPANSCCIHKDNKRCCIMNHTSPLVNESMRCGIERTQSHPTLQCLRLVLDCCCVWHYICSTIVILLFFFVFVDRSSRGCFCVGCCSIDAILLDNVGSRACCDVGRCWCKRCRCSSNYLLLLVSNTLFSTIQYCRWKHCRIVLLRCVQRCERCIVSKVMNHRQPMHCNVHQMLSARHYILRCWQDRYLFLVFVCLVVCLFVDVLRCV